MTFKVISNEAWLRFQKIMYDGKFISPVMPMRFKKIDERNCEVRSRYKVYSYEVADFAIEKSGSDKWIIKLESPTKEGKEYVWKLAKG